MLNQTLWLGSSSKRDGSHITLKKEGEINIITVPAHDQLKYGTFLAILRKAKIEKEDFLNKL